MMTALSLRLEQTHRKDMQDTLRVHCECGEMFLFRYKSGPKCGEPMSNTEALLVMADFHALCLNESMYGTMKQFRACL